MKVETALRLGREIRQTGETADGGAGNCGGLRIFGGQRCQRKRADATRGAGEEAAAGFLHRHFTG
jgi:hypothetical protein